MSRLDKITLLVACTIAILGLGIAYDFPVHWLAIPFGVALVVAVPLGVLYSLGRFVKWCWSRP